MNSIRDLINCNVRNESWSNVMHDLNHNVNRSLSFSARSLIESIVINSIHHIYTRIRFQSEKSLNE